MKWKCNHSFFSLQINKIIDDFSKLSHNAIDVLMANGHGRCGFKFYWTKHLWNLIENLFLVVNFMIFAWIWFLKMILTPIRVFNECLIYVLDIPTHSQHGAFTDVVEYFHNAKFSVFLGLNFFSTLSWNRFLCSGYKNFIVYLQTIWRSQQKSVLLIHSQNAWNYFFFSSKVRRFVVCLSKESKNF